MTGPPVAPARSPSEQRLQRLAQRRLERLGARAGLPLPEPPALPRLPLPDETIVQQPDVLPARPRPSALAERAIGAPPAGPGLPPPRPPTVLERLSAVVPKEPFESIQLGASRLMARLPGGVGEAYGREAEQLQNLREREQQVRESSPLMRLLSTPAGVADIVSSLEVLGRVPIAGAPLRGAETAVEMPGVGNVYREVGEAAPQVLAAREPATRRVAAVLTENLPTSAAGRIARATGREALRFGTLQGELSAIRGEPPETVAREAGAGELQGAGFGGGVQAAGELSAHAARLLALRQMRADVPPLEGPFQPAGMPEHVAVQGAAQRTALQIIERAPPALPAARPLGTPPGDPYRAAAIELRDLSLKPEKTPDDLVRMEQLKQLLAQQPPAPPAPPEPEGRPTVAPPIERRAVSREAPPSVVPPLAPSPRPPGARQIVLPAGAPDVLGGTSKEELERTGVAQLLADPGEKSVTRAELRQQLERRPLAFGEELYGYVASPALQQAHVERERAYEAYRKALTDKKLSGTYAEDVQEMAGLNVALVAAPPPGMRSPNRVLAGRALAGDLFPLAEALWRTQRHVLDLEIVRGEQAVRRGGSQYGQYTLPGGTHYREIVVTAQPPYADRQRELLEEKEKLIDKLRETVPTTVDQREPVRQRLNAIERELDVIANEPDLYRSPHWRAANPIGHLRLDDRTIMHDPTLFLEEVQSDVHQAGREEGYGDTADRLRLRGKLERTHARVRTLAHEIATQVAPRLQIIVKKDMRITNPPWSHGKPGKADTAEIVVEPETGHHPVQIGSLTLWPVGERAGPDQLNRGWVFNGFRGAVQNLSTFTRDPNKALDTIRERLLQEAWPLVNYVLSAAQESGAPWAFALNNQLEAASNELAAADLAYEKSRRAVPRLPLSRTEDWVGLLVRRALDEAVRTGKTRLAWTTGRQQSERYDMGHYIDKLVYRPENKMLIGYKDDETVITKAVKPDELPQWVGRDVAERLLAAPLDELGYHELHGNIAVGDVGMRTFYDEILPRVIKDQVRRLGAKVELDKSFIDVPMGADPDSDQYIPAGEQPVWSVEIPEAVRDKIKREGLYIAEPPRGRYGKKPKLELEKGRPRDIGAAMIEEYGETDVPQHAGFILTDGRLVNLSGYGGIRGDDHRIVEGLFKHPETSDTYSRWDAVQRVMDDGIARIHFSPQQRGGLVAIDVSRPLTGRQLVVLRRAIAGYGWGLRPHLVLDFTVDGETVATGIVEGVKPSDLEPAMQQLYDAAAKARSGKRVRELPAYDARDVGLPRRVEERLRRAGFVPSPWLAQRADVSEADAAFGSDAQMELALDKLAAQIHPPQEQKTFKGTPTLFYRQRAAASKKVVEDLKKGQATWIGREFPDVWPLTTAQMGLEGPNRASQKLYGELLDGIGAMLQAIRSPFVETLAFFATRGNRVVLTHMVSSGHISSASAEGPNGEDLMQAFIDEAAKAGATHVHSAHNHPSGKVDPSGLGADISTFGSLAYKARQAGMQPGVNLIIDDELMTVTTLERTDDGWSLKPRYVGYTYRNRVPWFDRLAPFHEEIRDPVAVGEIIHRLGRAHAGYLIHLDNGSAVAGLEPFTAKDLERPELIAQHLAEASRDFGAASTIIGLSDVSLYEPMLQAYRDSPTMDRHVLDIVALNAATNTWKSASAQGRMKPMNDKWLDTLSGRRVFESGMAAPWRGQPGYSLDPVIQGSRPLVAPRALPLDGPHIVREALGPGYGEDELPNTASILAQEALDAGANHGIAPGAEGTIGKLLTAFAGTRMEQIGAPLHLLLVEYERQRATLQQAVQSDILKESLNTAAVRFLARLPYFNEYRATTLLSWLRDKLPKVVGGKLGVTPDRQAVLFNAAEAIAEFGPDGQPVFRDVLERTGELDQQGYDRLVKLYGHPEKLKAEVDGFDRKAAALRAELARRADTLSPSAHAIERYKLKLRAKQEVQKVEAAQVLASLKAERNTKKDEIRELKALQALHVKDAVLDEDVAAALPLELEQAERELDALRADISRFEGFVAGRTPPGDTVDAKDVPAKQKELAQKLDRWRVVRGRLKDLDEVRRARWSTLRAFRRAYEAQARGQQVGQVRVTAEEAHQRWNALTPAEQNVVRRFAVDAERAKGLGLEAHVNRELAKLEYEISSDIEAYVHHYGFKDEGAMVLWFGSVLRRKKMIAGARAHRGGAEGFKRHLEGARLHGGLPLALQKLQNEFAEALERVMFTSPDPNLVRPLEVDEEPPEGFSVVTGRFGGFQGHRFAVANPIYRELEFFQQKPPAERTTSEEANRLWNAAKNGMAKAIYYWALNQLVSLGTAMRNFYSGGMQYASLVAEDLAGGNLAAAQHHLLGLAKAIAPSVVRKLPATEFGASQQTLRELDEAHGLFRAFMNTALIPFGMVENYYKRALTLSIRELEAARIAKAMLADGTIEQGDLKQVVQELFDNPSFEMRAAEELVRDAFAYNYNNIPLALKKMNKSALGKALLPFPIYGYKFARHAGRYAGAVSRLARMKGRAGDLQKAIAALLLFGIPAVLTWLGDEEGVAKTTDPGSGIKYDFDRSGRVYVGLNDAGRELWLRTSQFSFYGVGAVIGHMLHDRSLVEAKNYLADFYSIGPGFQALDYLRQVRNRYQTYRNNAALAGDFVRSWIPFHRPLETMTRMVDPTRRKQETFTESMLYAVPIPEPALNQFGLSRGEPRTARAGRELVPPYDPRLEFLKEFAGLNIKPIDPQQALDEYRTAARRAQMRERRSKGQSARLRRLEERRQQRQEEEP